MLGGAYFLRCVSIKRNVDFKRMYYQSNYKIGFFTVVYLKKVNFDGVFLGITVSKKVGNAVERNRVRRIIKAAFAELLKNKCLCGFSIVIVAKRSCLKVKSHTVFKDLKSSLMFFKKKNLIQFQCS